jgi:hypothetical protein
MNVLYQACTKEKVNMSDLGAMVLTVISGVIVFFVCEIFRELWLVPLRDFYTIKSRIVSSLRYHARCYGDPIDIKTASQEMLALHEAASNDLRQLACDLSGFTESLHFKAGIPPKEKLFEASKQLIGLSNGMYKPYGVSSDQTQAEHNVKRVSIISELLGIYFKKD